MGKAIRTSRGSNPARRFAACRNRFALAVTAGALLFGGGEVSAAPPPLGLAPPTSEIVPDAAFEPGWQDEEETPWVDAGTGGRWLTYIAVFDACNVPS